MKIGEIKFDMEGFWLVFGVTVGVVALFVLGMSITLIFKGHHIDSEIGDNKHMKERGIKCAAQQMREQERAFLRNSDSAEDDGSCSHNCGSCSQAECVEQAPEQKSNQ